MQMPNPTRLKQSIPEIMCNFSICRQRQKNIPEMSGHRKTSITVHFTFIEVTVRTKWTLDNRPGFKTWCYVWLISCVISGKLLTTSYSDSYFLILKRRVIFVDLLELNEIKYVNVDKMSYGMFYNCGDHVKIWWYNIKVQFTEHNS